MGLKYLWNIMNLLQFLIFMLMWQVDLPRFTYVCLSELKSLALLEFLDFIKDYFLQKFGLDSSSCVNDDLACHAAI